ncbi:hypothetical protein Hanom_Chr07g00590701 [Helianthus anomalus]
MDRIPTREALLRRNINIGNQVYSFCNFAVESAVHLFTGCGFVDGIGCGSVDGAGLSRFLLLRCATC